MKFAYSSNAYRRMTLLEAIERIAALGYDGLEIMADVPHAWPAAMTEAEISEIQSVLRRHELEISNINAFMMTAVEDFWHPSWIEPDAKYRERRVQHTVDALHMAHRLGAASITTEPGGPLPVGMSRSDAIKIFIDGLTVALEIAEKVGVMLLVEPEPGLLIENAAEFEELAGHTHSPMFGLNFDVGHFFCVGEDLPGAIERLSRWTRHYHLEDIPESRIHQHMIPGEGAIDFGSVMQAIQHTGYDGWLTVELYPYLSDPDAAGKAALAFLKELSFP